MTTLNGALETIDPSLANLLSLKLFQRSTSVAQNGDYVQALAGITALELTITPPDICALVNNVLSVKPISLVTDGLTLPATPVTDVLDALGSIVPDCFEIINIAEISAQAIPEGAVAALTGPITFKAASVSSVAEYKVVAATATPEEPALPRTGMNETLLLVIGGLMAAAALGLRRLGAPVKVRANRKY
jgi:LPXTG-motif cell wall-anchored protein